MATTIASSAEVAPGVEFGDLSRIEAYCVVGYGSEDGRSADVVIGRNAIIRTHAVVYRGVRAGDDLHVGHGALIREQTVLGSRVSIGSHSIVEHQVLIADDVRLHSGCFVPEYSVLRRGAWLGPGVIVTNARYPNRADTKSALEGVDIGEGAVVGAGAVLLPGIAIGARALVGAGAVVVKDVPAGATVFGNPASSSYR